MVWGSWEGPSSPDEVLSKWEESHPSYDRGSDDIHSGFITYPSCSALTSVLLASSYQQNLRSTVLCLATGRWRMEPTDSSSAEGLLYKHFSPRFPKLSSRSNSRAVWPTVRMYSVLKPWSHGQTQPGDPPAFYSFTCTHPWISSMPRTESNA